MSIVKKSILCTLFIGLVLAAPLSLSMRASSQAYRVGHSWFEATIPWLAFCAAGVALVSWIAQEAFPEEERPRPITIPLETLFKTPLATNPADKVVSQPVAKERKLKKLIAAKHKEYLELHASSPKRAH